MHRCRYEETSLVTEPNRGKPEIPTTYVEAMNCENSEKWKEVLELEFNTLTKMGRWESVQLSPKRKVITTKWVFDVKLNENGEIYCLKAGLVAKGFSQVPGIDFHDVFLPLTKYTSIRMMLAFAALFSWKHSLINMKNAFFDVPLNEKMYVVQPEGFVVPGRVYVYLLKKALY